MRKPTQKNSSTDQSEQEYLQEHEMSRRDFMLDSLALGGLAAAFGMSASTAAWGNVQPPADEVVRIGYLPITDATVLLVAHAKGFFEEEGLKTERPTLIRGWSPLVEGFAAGKFNLVHFLLVASRWQFRIGIPCITSSCRWGYAMQDLLRLSSRRVTLSQLTRSTFRSCRHPICPRLWQRAR